MNHWYYCFPLAILIVAVLFFGGTGIASLIGSPHYLYQGVIVTDLQHYQKIAGEIRGKQEIQATAYDSVNDKILVTYHFLSNSGAAAKYSIPAGAKLSYWGWLGQ